MNGGDRAISIDEVPLDRCSHRLQPLDIVLVNTAAGTAIGKPNFVDIGCGMGYEATMYLTTRGVRVTGTDACFPHKVRGASAGWTRAVAIFEE
jgi:hypothetical protein